MFSSIRSFLYRHRRKFLVSGVVVGGVVLLSRYAQRALREWQERETKEFLERTRKQQHYESNERTCNHTALTLISAMKENIAKLIKTEELIAQLKEGASNKIAVWEQLKILAFTRAILVIYLSSLLMITLRLEFNLIGGYMFNDSIQPEDKKVINAELQAKYLSFCQHLLEDGTAKLYDVVNEKVNLVLAQKSLKEKLSVKDVEQLLWAIHSSISEDSRNPCQQLASYIIPADVTLSSAASAAVFAKMITETRDLLESDEVISLCNSCVTRGLTFLIDNIAEYYDKDCGNGREKAVASTSATPDEFFAANILYDDSFKIALAKVIPIVIGLVTQSASTSDLSNSWMQQLILMDNLKVMGANVYETFSV